jgi:uncharacterized protein YbaP (TraB family)
MLFKIIRRALALLGLATAAYAAPQPAVVQATTAARPALWEVTDQDTTIYLFGTIHLLPDNYTWRTPAIDKAIASSSTLYVETIVDPKDPKPLIAAMRSLGYSNGLPPLADRIDPAKRPLLEAAIAKSGIPRAYFDKMETWAAAFTLLGVQYQEIGLGGENGPEQTLRDAFGAAGKPVGQLETNAEQLGFFDVLPENAQRSLLEGAIESPTTATADFSEMLRGWASGDVDAIAKTFNHDLADTPDLRAILLDKRNANWSRWIEQRMTKPGVVFMAVGAGHLAGGDSVQSLLQRDGYHVRRIQ